MNTINKTSSASGRWQWYLLGATIIGFAHWFFGNLYETVVLTPNLLGLGPHSLELWQAFFKYSDPIYNFIPLNPITLFVTLTAVVLAWPGVAQRRWWLGWLAFFALCTGLLTLYIVTQINLKVYFGPLSSDSEWLRSIQQLSAFLSVLRVLAEAGALYSAIRAFSLTPRPVRKVKSIISSQSEQLEIGSR